VAICHLAMLPAIPARARLARTRSFAMIYVKPT
jgi:hypothetical protein